MDSITVPYRGDDLLEHEKMLLMCWRKKDYIILACYCAEEKEDSYLNKPIQGKPTIRLPIEEN